MAFEKLTHLQTSQSREKDSSNNIFWYGEVVDISDPTGANRIRVKIKGIDDKTANTDLPWASPLIPLFVVTNPKVGELVKIFTINVNDIMNKREYIGPCFTSYTELEYQSAITALSVQDMSPIVPSKSLKKIPSANGVYVDSDDIAFQGRDNTDIIFKAREVQIRAGKFVVNNKTTLNVTNPSYIKLKLSKDGTQSTASTVANKILLMTYNGSKKFNNIITDEDIQSIIEKSFSAAYAEPIIEFLKLIQIFVATHIHPQNLPPNHGVGKIDDIIKFDLNEILANNIKIN